MLALYESSVCKVVNAQVESMSNELEHREKSSLHCTWMWTPSTLWTSKNLHYFLGQLRLFCGEDFSGRSEIWFYVFSNRPWPWVMSINVARLALQISDRVKYSTPKLKLINPGIQSRLKVRRNDAVIKKVYDLTIRGRYGAIAISIFAHSVKMKNAADK